MQIPLAGIQELLDYHYDRRERTYDFLTTIALEDFVRPVNIGWNSMRGTLMHCLFAEEFWVQHVILRGPRPEIDFRAYPDVPSVRRLGAQVRQRTLAFVGSLTEADLQRTETVTFSSGSTLAFPITKALVHVITHDTHHRGQVMAVARQLGYEPPELDLM